MIILFLANAGSIHTVRWVNALAARGHTVHLVHKCDDRPKDNAIDNRVILHSLKYSGKKSYLLNSLRLKQLHQKINPDICNAHYASGYGLLARAAGIKPLVLSVWGSDVYDFPYRSIMHKRIIVKNLQYADQIASTSISMADQVRKLLNDRDKEISVTPFGVDINKFARNFPNAKCDKKIVIGNIKTLSPKYGIDDFIKAIKILRENLIRDGKDEVAYSVVVDIYGDGPLKIELEGLISNFGLQEIISLKGRIPNDVVPGVLQDFDIFCATSVYESESFGVAVVEAMSMSLPVVATNVSGFREVVDNGITGIVVEKGQPEAIAEALRKLVIDKELRLKYGQNGRKKVEKLYNWDENVKTMVNIYQTVINSCLSVGENR